MELEISTNFTEFKIHNSGERCLWIIYLLIVLLSSLIGDSIILIASIKYNAIKLNKFLVTIMQHIAVCDILASLSYVLPTLISLIANEWILGEVIAYVHIYLDTASMVGSNILICALICSKLLLLEFPLHARKWTVTKAHVACSCIWLLAFSIPALRLCLDKGFIFDFIHYNINYNFISQHSKAKHIAITSVSVLSMDIPVVIVILTTCWTLVHLIRSRKAARRVGGDQRFQGIVTVVTTAIVFCISVLPYQIVALVVVYCSDLLQHHHGTKLRRFFESLTTFNIMINVFIYGLTVPSFKKFLSIKTITMLSWLRGCFSRNTRLGKTQDAE